MAWDDEKRETSEEKALNALYDNVIEKIALRGKNKHIQMEIPKTLWRVRSLVAEAYPEALVRLKSDSGQKGYTLSVTFK